MTLGQKIIQLRVILSPFILVVALLDVILMIVVPHNVMAPLYGGHSLSPKFQNQRTNFSVTINYALTREN